MDFEKEWLSIFAKDISKSQKRKYLSGTGNFIWHMFSYNLVDPKSFLIGDEARAAFDSVNKKGARYYDQEKIRVIRNNSSLTSEDLDIHGEHYIISKDNSWTYIKTHEDDWCGPYFYRI